MANTIANVKDFGGIIAKAQAGLFEDNLQFCKTIQRADETDFDGKNGFKAGDTLYINSPLRGDPTSTFDQTGTIGDITETKIALPLDIISSQAYELNTLEIATEIGAKDFLNRIVKPTMVSMATDFENKVLAKATDAVYNSVGTSGSNTFDTDVILEAREKINESLAPKDDERHFLFNSKAGRLAVGARKGLFQSSDEIAKQYKKGLVGMADGFMWHESELIQRHTNGNDVAFEVRTTVSTQGASQIVVEGLTTTTGTVTKGTVFTVAGVFAVHPQTKETLDSLQQFVVLEDETADGSGYATLSVSPAMYTTGSLQNISGFPTDGDAITPVGAASTGYKQNLAYHKNAFRLVTVPLVMPKNAEFASQYNYKGINVAVVYDWDQVKRSMVLRFDILGGLAIERPEWACRVPA